jgi:hypothetical protein
MSVDEIAHGNVASVPHSGTPPAPLDSGLPDPEFADVRPIVVRDVENDSRVPQLGFDVVDADFHFFSPK